MKANYHTHTYRCGHAKGSDREYVENAIKGGLKVLGFADHCPFVYNDGYVSTMRMKLSEVEGYFRSLSDLKQEYKNEITIYIGLECEYIPELKQNQDKLLSDYPLDYKIMGEHYINPENRGRYAAFCRQEGFFKEYIDTIIEGFGVGDYRYLAHPDLFCYADEQPDYVEQYTRLCAFLKERDIPLEYNLLGFSEGRWYPSDSFYKIAAKVGNKLIIGCDAHEPGVLSDKSLHEKCLDSAKKYGMEIIEFLPGLK